MLALFIVALLPIALVGVNSEEKVNQTAFSVEGRISLHKDLATKTNWRANSRILLDYGKYVGLVRYFSLYCFNFCDVRFLISENET